jgi:hypothetical protein
MSTTIEATAVSRPLGVSPAAPRIAERRFYLGFTVALALGVLLGFARTFFFRAWYPEWAAAHAAPEAFFYWHGAAIALWYGLLIVQASLITTRRVLWHRRLGLAGAALAAVVAILGVVGSLVAARRPTGFIDIPLPPLQFLIVPLGAIAIFGLLVSLAIARRRDTQAHKRYMLLASIVMLEAAVGRWPFAFMNAASPIPFFDMPSLMTDVFLVPVVVWDIWSRGRLHPATILGAVTIVAFHLFRMPLASTPGWQAFAGWAVR